MFFGVLSMHQCNRLHTIRFMFFAMSGNGHQTCNWPPPRNRKFKMVEPNHLGSLNGSSVTWAGNMFIFGMFTTWYPDLGFWNCNHLYMKIHVPRCSLFLRNILIIGKYPHSTVHEAEHTNLFPSGFARGSFEQRFDVKPMGWIGHVSSWPLQAHGGTGVTVFWHHLDMGGTIIESYIDFAHMPTHIYPLNPTGNFYVSGATTQALVAFDDISSWPLQARYCWQHGGGFPWVLS